ncbi:hypothetical protein H8S33_14495 [Ornithinibacillus sp. BX22]|uniref:PepSY domain-containing protein n=2 Tax=Ornithinibacillus TaxID=484508 RepID=A0A923RK75_9BACI|nr:MULTISPECIES: hypothetical protein [Ornithinibacillus]MBC5638003.1 hypothetical protein [Ornithinibacillus hominis]MBS3681891.1 hypothetical protein [Ornithinibacillus massiliensis]
MEKETNNRGPWTLVAVLSVILIVGLLLNQPMNRDKAIEKAKEFAPAEFEEVISAQFIPINENQLGAELWEIQLGNDDNQKAILTINAQSEKLVEGKIIDGDTGEVLDEF